MVKHKFDIPESFEMLGATITVRFIQEPPMEEVGNVGVHDIWRNQIRLYHKCRGGELSRASVEQTFFHEMFHGQLRAAGYAKLAEDEEFVDRVSAVMHQNFVTMEGSVIHDETVFSE